MVRDAWLLGLSPMSVERSVTRHRSRPVDLSPMYLGRTPSGDRCHTPRKWISAEFNGTAEEAAGVRVEVSRARGVSRGSGAAEEAGRRCAAHAKARAGGPASGACHRSRE